MVEAEVQVRAVADGGGQVSDKIPFRADVHRVPAEGRFAGPQREALVMFGGEDYVLGSGLLEQRRPLCRVEKLGGKLRSEIGVRESGPVVFLHEADILGILSTAPVLPEPLASKAGHREDAPVDEDAHLAGVIPGGQRPRVEGLPGGLVLGQRRAQHRQHRQQRQHHTQQHHSQPSRTVQHCLTARTGPGPHRPADTRYWQRRTQTGRDTAAVSDRPQAARPADCLRREQLVSRLCKDIWRSGPQPSVTYSADVSKCTNTPFCTPNRHLFISIRHIAIDFVTLILVWKRGGLFRQVHT